MFVGILKASFLFLTGKKFRDIAKTLNGLWKFEGLKKMKWSILVR